MCASIRHHGYSPCSPVASSLSPAAQLGSSLLGSHASLQPGTCTRKNTIQLSPKEWEYCPISYMYMYVHMYIVHVHLHVQFQTLGTHIDFDNNMLTFRNSLIPLPPKNYMQSCITVGLCLSICICTCTCSCLTLAHEFCPVQALQ